MNENRNLTLKINIKKVFNHVFLPLFEDKHRYYVLPGGRGSGKSYAVPLRICIKFLQEPNRNAIFVRKTAVSSRTSTFNNTLRALKVLKIEDRIKINTSTMTFTFPNGNQIKCVGLDDADKLKSLMFENGCDLSDVWYEEGDQISEKDFETIDLTARGKNTRIYLTFNPVSKENWIYKRFFKFGTPDGVRIIRSCYLDNRFLNDDYIALMERMKNEDYELYKILGLGIWGSLKNIVYSKYEIKEFNYEDEFFDTICYGLDFGGTDPNAFVKVGIKDRVIYILQEMEMNGTDDEIFDYLHNVLHIPLDAYIWADHQPSRILRLRQLGYRNIVNANKKDKTSSVYQLSRCKLIIHPSCECFIKEVSTYKWKTNAAGEVIEQLIDGFDHLMDAFLYSMRDWMNRVYADEKRKLKQLEENQNKDDKKEIKNYIKPISRSRNERRR